MKKILLLLLFLFMPIFINAQTCNKNDIVIKSVIFDSTSGNASEKSTPVINGKSIKLDLNMNHVNDIVTYKVVIENNSKNNYEIEKILGKSNYIEYVFEDESSVIESNTTKELHLKAIYRNEVPSNLLNNGTYNDSDDIVLSLSTLVNPKTGYTFILFIIVLGVIGLIINLSLNNQNAIKSLNFCNLLFSGSCIEFSFVIINNKGFFLLLIVL